MSSGDVSGRCAIDRRLKRESGGLIFALYRGSEHTHEAVYLQKENHRFPDRNDDAAAKRHFQDFHRHHHLSIDFRYRHRHRHGGLGFAKNVELRALIGSFDDFVVNKWASPSDVMNMMRHHVPVNHVSRALIV